MHISTVVKLGKPCLEDKDIRASHYTSQHRNILLDFPAGNYDSEWHLSSRKDITRANQRWVSSSPLFSAFESRFCWNEWTTVRNETGPLWRPWGYVLPALLTSGQLLCLPSALKATSTVSKPTAPFQLTIVAWHHLISSGCAWLADSLELTVHWKAIGQQSCLSAVRGAEGWWLGRGWDCCC